MERLLLAGYLSANRSASTIAPRLGCVRVFTGIWWLALDKNRNTHHLFVLLTLKTNSIPIQWVLHKKALAVTGIRLL